VNAEEEVKKVALAGGRSSFLPAKKLELKCQMIYEIGIMDLGENISQTPELQTSREEQSHEEIFSRIFRLLHPFLYLRIHVIAQQELGAYRDKRNR